MSFNEVLEPLPFVWRVGVILLGACGLPGLVVGSVGLLFEGARAMFSLFFILSNALPVPMLRPFFLMLEKTSLTCMPARTCFFSGK